MAEDRRARFTPPRLGQREFARSTTLPRWFLREAVEAFALSPYDVAAFLVIADNLDAHGISRTATTLVATRGGMGEGGATKAIARLVSKHLLYELDPRRKGHIMRYSIPVEMPWAGGGWR